MNSPKRTQGLHEKYAVNPAQADADVWGRRVHPLTRRGFLSNGGLLAMATVLGAKIVFSDKMPGGLIPAALAQTPEPFTVPGKDGLVYLNDRPINAETPAHLLDDDVTPANRLFMRNNGHPPDLTGVDVEQWTLRIDGESCLHPRSFTLAELKRDFPHHTYRMTLECGGNGRAEFNPAATGNQWTTGAVGCPEWTGVRLRDVLESCGIADTAVYIGYHGADLHLTGNPDRDSISRGVPMHKALEDESLLAFGMNGTDIPAIHGHPLRLVCGGWPASVCGKWLNRLEVRDRVHDGEKMTGSSYRVPMHPVQPGSDVPNSDMRIIGSMPVKSLITTPASGITHASGETLEVRGHAWAGDLAVQEMWLSIDFGATWQRAELKPPANRFAWQRWTSQIRFPEIGYYEIWGRAVDTEGRSQPMVVPGWNPKGYLNNACHRIAVQVS